MKNYQPFNIFVLRTPLLPLNFLKEFLSTNVINETALKEICKQKEVQEAIFLASPNLYTKISKWLNGELKDKKETERLQYSTYKYFSRMSSRSTPFGLFAGITVGQIGDNNNFNIPLLKEYRRYTRLDMNYLCALASDLSKIHVIRNSLKYFPNTSIYQAGDQLRYVEYTYVNSKRSHHIVSVDNTEYLQAVLSASKNGAYAKNLAELLVDEEISHEEAESFITELIDSQLLILGLEPSVTGIGLLENTLEILRDTENIEPVKESLKAVQTGLKEIDKLPPGANPAIYSKIAEKIKQLNTDFEAKFLFQTDMLKPTPGISINKNLINDIKQGIAVLDKLSTKPEETNISKFRDAFYKIYEDAEIPLLQALDTESGIGYIQNKSSGDMSPLIDDIVLPQTTGNSYKIEWNSINAFLFKKYLQSVKENKYEIEITDKEIEKLTGPLNNTGNMPVSISTMVQIFNSKEGEIILMSSAGGASAANLLGRFCHTDDKLLEHVKNITKKEEEYFKDKIIAEIVHLPESRIGNILHRPVLRKYEIPYLAKAAVEEDFQIRADDLFVSVTRNKVVLRSKKLNKEVVPRLSSAHNFSFNALPVYQFLCDLQTQEIKGGVGFNWGPLANEYPFLPRVTYKNIIFSLASWNILKEDFEKIIKIKEDKQLIKEITQWREKLNMPIWVALEEGDNELTLNLNNILSVKTLISLVKKKGNFKLIEFLYNEDNLTVRNEDGGFTNEFIFSFYKER